ncbi:MAG: LytR C-terminal domain-containing protein [Gammaproteobacteria bacterium]|nr:LytR C-terminal domain-containing protein [Gammaproteobacteria bacterium]
MYRLQAGLFLLLAVFSVNTSALNLTDGHTGLYALRSAYTLPQGDYSYGLWLSSQQYAVPASSSQLLLNDLSMSFHQGVTDQLEVGMYFPARMGVASGNFDFQHFGFSIKYKTDETPATKDAVSFTLYGGILATDPATGLGSGESNYGISFDYSNKVGGSIIHSNIGIENSDAISITAPSTATFSPSSKMFWRMGGEIGYSETSSFNIGVELTSDLSGGGTATTLLPSYTYNSTDHHLRYTLGLGYNLQPTANMPSSSIYMGMNYNFESPSKKMSQLEHRLVELEGMLNNLTTSQSSQDASLEMVDGRLNYLYDTDVPIYNDRVDNIEKQIAELKKRPVAKATTPRVMSTKGQTKSLKVEIVNRSGSKKLAKRISERLKNNGYIIVRVIEGKKKLKRSHVYYQNGYDKQAVSLGHSLPKNQIIGKAADLAYDVNLRLVIGDDLK